MTDEHAQRIIELEIELALQADMLESLSETVARLQHSLDLQQSQLRLLYQRLQDSADVLESGRLSDEVPPHY